MALLALVFLIASASAAQTFIGNKLITVKPQTLDQVEYLIQLQQDTELDFWKQTQGVGLPADIRVTTSQLEYVDKHFPDVGLTYSIKHYDIQSLIDNERTGSPRGHRFSTTDVLTRYATQTEIDDWLKNTANKCGSRCKLMEFGQSYEKRDMKVIKIVSGTGSSTKPAVFVDGGIHAREWISPVFVNNMIDKLINDYTSDGTVRRLVDTYDWYVIPLLNPDGYNFSHTDDRLWRKNRAETRRARCVGVDLNRNFGYEWGVAGVSSNPCSEVYLGTEAFSEPESKNLRDFLASIPNLEVYLTFHSYGQYVLYPWGYARENAPNYQDLAYAGNKLKEVVEDFTGEHWIVGNSAIALYPSAGASDDWAMGGAGATYAYTIELPPDEDSIGFVLPEREIPGVVSSVWPGVKAMMSAIIDREGRTVRQQPTHHARKQVKRTDNIKADIFSDSDWWKEILATKLKGQ